MSETVRKRQARPRSRKPSEQPADPLVQDNAIEPPASGGDDPKDHKDVAPDEAKLTALAIMKARGFTQIKMADEFGMSVRTIHNWLKKLSAIENKILEHMDPNGEVERILCRYGILELEIKECQRIAIETKDPKTSLACIKERRCLEHDRNGFLERIGLFDRVQLPDNARPDPTADDASMLSDIFGKAMKAGLTGLKTDNGTGEK